MNFKIVKNESDYAEAVARLERLGDLANPTEAQVGEMELLALILEKYDRENHQIDLPDPIEAIKFRMEQENLSRKDLAVYIGSEAKVSEVLNRKVSLSLNMVRALSEGLDIPAGVLIQKPKEPLARIAVKDYPFAEMFKRGYFAFTGSLREAKEKAEQLLEEFFCDYTTEPNFMFCRRREGDSNVNALRAWHCRLRHRMNDRRLSEVFRRERVNEEFCRRLAGLSCYSEGPRMAVELLASIGVTLLFERHLPRTYLDGATFMMDERHPVIGLTLRYNRWDYFWFTLLHEIGHLKFHLKGKADCFMDNTDASAADAECECEANAFAEDMLIPRALWKASCKRLCRAHDANDIIDFSRQNFVSADVVAGRIRRMTGDYTRFRSIDQRVNINGNHDV